MNGAVLPSVLAFAGVIALVQAHPWCLRLRGTRGTYAVRPRWLVALGVALLVAAAIMALA